MPPTESPLKDILPLERHRGAQTDQRSISDGVKVVRGTQPHTISCYFRGDNFTIVGHTVYRHAVQDCIWERLMSVAISACNTHTSTHIHNTRLAISTCENPTLQSISTHFPRCPV